MAEPLEPSGIVMKRGELPGDRADLSASTGSWRAAKHTHTEPTHSRRLQPAIPPTTHPTSPRPTSHLQHFFIFHKPSPTQRQPWRTICRPITHNPNPPDKHTWKLIKTTPRRHFYKCLIPANITAGGSPCGLVISHPWRHFVLSGFVPQIQRGCKHTLLIESRFGSWFGSWFESWFESWLESWLE